MQRKRAMYLVSENEFVGTKEQFEEYKKLFLKQNEFPSYISEENYEEYIKMVNSKEFQKQYFEMKNEKRDFNKPKMDSENREIQVEGKGTCPTCYPSFGAYPNCNRGYILGTDNPSSSGTSLFATGHIGIVYDCGQVTEAMPDDGVRTTRTDWKTRYKDWSVYGLKVGSGLTQSQHNQAADWVHRQVGKAYNWVYTWTSRRDEFYCSHLAYAAYRDLWNVYITTVFADWTIITPASIFNSNNTIWVYER